MKLFKVFPQEQAFFLLGNSAVLLLLPAMTILFNWNVNDDWIVSNALSVSAIVMFASFLLSGPYRLFKHFSMGVLVVMTVIAFGMEAHSPEQRAVLSLAAWYALSVSLTLVAAKVWSMGNREHQARVN